MHAHWWVVWSWVHLVAAPLILKQESHLVPQWSVELSATQAPLHLWYPDLQVIPQVPAEQVLSPLGSEGQGEQDFPQLLTLALVSERQAPSQA